MAVFCEAFSIPEFVSDWRPTSFRFRKTRAPRARFQPCFSGVLSSFITSVRGTSPGLCRLSRPYAALNLESILKATGPPTTYRPPRRDAPHNLHPQPAEATLKLLQQLHAHRGERALVGDEMVPRVPGHHAIAIALGHRHGLTSVGRCLPMRSDRSAAAVGLTSCKAWMGFPDHRAGLRSCAAVPEAMAQLGPQCGGSGTLWRPRNRAPGRPGARRHSFQTSAGSVGPPPCHF